MASDRDRGAQIFQQSCVECHGELGQGTDYYSIPLRGDLPPSELARIISATMPEGDPQACSGEDAEAVARYLYDAFYSPFAQARNRPPRRELSRLTVSQLEQSIADLVGSFRWQGQWGDQRGLTVKFTKRVNTGVVDQPVDLVLPKVDFFLSDLKSLDQSYLDPTAKGKEEFGNDRIDVHVHVDGSVYAPETGEYEFFVRTAGGVELWINSEPIIAERVRSDEQTELRARTKLLGGRAYPIALSTARIAQDDPELTLGWRRPDGVDEAIPTRFLSTSFYPQIEITDVAFPPDDRSVGYVRGASVSRAWDEAVTAAALETTESVIDKLDQLAGLKPEEAELDQARANIAAQDFCLQMAEQAFRRKLTDDERWRFVERYFQSAAAGLLAAQEGPPADVESDSPSTAWATERALLAILKSPRFLYPEIGYALDASQTDARVAGRLALALWDSLPDKPLQEAAKRNGLSDTEAARRQAERMLSDPRTRAKVLDFFSQWLRLDDVAQLSRDPEAFPDFNDRVAADMRSSLELFLEDVVWKGDSDLRRLFLSDRLYVNVRLAEFLGIEGIDPAQQQDPEAFIEAPAETDLRSGVVSHPFMVTSLSYYRDTSPIHRGVFLARHILGRSLRPPPEAVAPLAPELSPELTTRERVSLQTSPHQCQSCHVLINDLGFTLEHFDAVGRVRQVDLGKPVDTSGGYVATDGSRIKLRGSRDLAKYLADSPDVHRSFVTQLFEHLTKQPMLAYGQATQDALLKDFRDHQFSIRRLLVSAAVTAAMAD
ncbi:DUF1592 domain-containing protein [Botrimarina hoheduenensis]|uniref:DUF1592 domain-containing protein n=1 Tax=Botrimarina hoheduenensis TaxID=2528000 RepID=UPI001E5021F7|nr:DUF1592 domain-containing protein [Botrimarina hoheduenensis]